MVQIISLTNEYDVEHTLGTFLDESYIDQLITDDVDVYKPSILGNDEQNVLLKFRKNVFSPELQKEAYEGLIDGATASHNRGMAAGDITVPMQLQHPDAKIGREWVTNYQMEILNYFMQPANQKLFDNDVNEFVQIQNRFEGKKDKIDSKRGHVWLREKLTAENFVFENWANEVVKKSKDDQITEARWVMEHLISSTNYANPVFSGIAGYFDRYPRIPFCRETSYTANQKEKYEKGIPFIEGISNWFEELLPNRYNKQKQAIEKIDPAFRIGNSVYTTLTLNRNFRTAAHRDAGDLTEGFGNLTTLSNGNGWEGGYLCFPKYRVAVDIRPGDVLLMDVHEIHGNTPLKGINGKDPERMSIVCYFRENMFGCSTKKFEDLRKKFTEFRRTNKNHPEWREYWNGISPGIWDSEEWIDYLEAMGESEYAESERNRIFGSTLDEFFG